MRVILLKKQLTYSPTAGESMQTLPAMRLRKWVAGGGVNEERTATPLPPKKSLEELFTNYDTLSRKQHVFGYQSAAIYVCSFCSPRIRPTAIVKVKGFSFRVVQTQKG